MKKQTKKQAKIHYEPEADVLSWEMSRDPIDFAQESGNVVVHFSRRGAPVLVEILEARKFLTDAQKLVSHHVPPSPLAQHLHPLH